MSDIIQKIADKMALMSGHEFDDLPETKSEWLKLGCCDRSGDAISCEGNYLKDHFLYDAKEIYNIFAQEIERLEAELAKHQWRTDIENAPRDGSYVLVLERTSKIPVVGYQKNGEWLEPTGHAIIGPTHWKTLDKPEG